MVTQSALVALTLHNTKQEVTLTSFYNYQDRFTMEAGSDKESLTLRVILLLPNARPLQNYLPPHIVRPFQRT